MAFFEFTITETRQKVVRIEADNYEESEAIAEELWHEGHEIFVLGDDDLIVTELTLNDDRVRNMLRDAASGEPIRVIVLEPRRKARTCMTRLSWEELSSCETEIQISQLDDEIYLIYGGGQTINRAVRSKDGDVSEIIFGTVFICGFKDGKLVGLSEKEAERYSRMYDRPEDFFIIGEFVAAIPRSVE